MGRSRSRRWLSEGIIDRLSLGDKLGAEESLSDRLVGWVRRWVQRRQFAGVVTQIDRKKDLVSVCCCFFASLILFCSTSYVEVVRRALVAEFLQPFLLEMLNPDHDVFFMVCHGPTQ